MSATAGSSLSLRRNISWTLLGNMVYALSQWGMLVLLARLSSPHTVGQYSLALAVSAPVYMALNLQLRGVQATDAAQVYRFGDYLTLRLLMTLLALLTLGGLLFLYAPDTRLVISLIGLAKAFEAISDVLYGRMQAHERMDNIARSTLFKGPISLLALLIGYLWAGLPGAAGLLAAGWLLLLLGYDLPNARRLSTRQDLQTGGLPVLWQLFKVSVPLGIVMGLVSLTSNLPRYQIQASLGTSALGIYSALAYLMVAVSIIISAVGQATSPRLARQFLNGEYAAFQKLLGRMVLGGLLLGLLGMAGAGLIGGPVLHLLYGAAYAKEATLFTWLMLAATFNYMASFLGYGMTAARRFREQVPLFAAVTGLLWLLSAVLVPRYGLPGAALATLIANVFQLLGSTLIIIQALRSRRLS